jgi:N-acetylmuramoyl-L-alanine amidase
MKTQIALIVGHEPGGGAEGERLYNIKVRSLMATALVSLGLEVFLYDHKIKSYGARQDAMAAAVRAAQPNNKVCVELHYNDVDDPQANGHQFHYNARESLARCFANAFQSKFPNSRPRQDKGIFHTPRGDGAGFLVKSPGAAVLTEPFFHSNPKENEFFKNHQEEVAMAYCSAIEAFLNL